ncbi:hypothetical protein R3P38DRAFT_3496931 [Favolaschia claudopus]|uniref:Uncharacterized protein n=1 Tax=Favolaschia claudopus TaxID=2862362 RepID=A0AAW0C7M8_9AGAR
MRLSLIVNGTLVVLLAMTNHHRLVVLAEWVLSALGSPFTIPVILVFYGLILIYLLVSVYHLGNTDDDSTPSRRRRTQLVPYYNSEGQLQGWVREEKSQKTRRTSHSQHNQTSSLPAPTPITAPAERNVASTPANPTTSLPLPLASASAPAPLSLEEASSLSYWDGFPDRRLRCHFTAQQLEDTSQLAVYWVGNRLSGKRGSPTAATPEKGKVSHFQCAGVVECESKLGKIRIPCFYSSDPPQDHDLVGIFDAALPLLVKLLTTLPGEHPVINSYNKFFEDRPEHHRDSEKQISQWLPGGPDQPSAELIALMLRPIEKLQYSRPASVSNEEWNRRILGIGTTLLQLLAIQHELEEPLNLNGDIFVDLVEDEVKAADSEVAEAERAMILALDLKVLRHRKYWDKQRLTRHIEHFEKHHTTFDATYRPATYLRIGPRKTRQPVIAVEIGSRVRRREEDDDSDYADEKPATKRQATARTLRPRGKDSQSKKKVIAGKIVQSGRGWDIVEMDDSEEE